MTGKLLRSSAGFTYLAAIVMVVILGIMLAKGAVVWTTKMQRERERELIFRGTQYRDALRRWYQLTPLSGFSAQPAVIPPAAVGPRELKDLLMDFRSADKKRYLRKLYTDPMTGKEFVEIREGGKIVGVRSSSEAEPIKQDFTDQFDLEPGDFKGKTKYSEWQFFCNHWPKQDAAGGGVTGLPPGSSNPGTTGSGTTGGGSTGSTGSGTTGGGSSGR